ncbi:MAG: acyltransferase domain-containing protein [Bacteroidota bacterium]
MEKPVAHIFPAFVPEYKGYEIDAITKHGTDFTGLLKSASAITGSDLTSFNIASGNFLDDELKSQYITYIMACAVSDILHKNGQKPAMTAGYSMGLYAALYHNRALTFESGLHIITLAYRCIHEAAESKSFGMGVIGGLEENDIEKIITLNQLDCRLTNLNSSVSFVLSGMKQDVETALLLAKEEGALQTRMMNVAHPYHSDYIRTASAALQKQMEPIEFSRSCYSLISLINQQIIMEPEQLSAEVVRNISNRINWHKTFKYMLETGIHDFIECGAGESLQKIGKFIDGDFNISGLKKL